MCSSYPGNLQGINWCKQLPSNFVPAQLFLNEALAYYCYQPTATGFLYGLEFDPPAFVTWTGVEEENGERGIGSNGWGLKCRRSAALPGKEVSTEKRRGSCRAGECSGLCKYWCLILTGALQRRCQYCLSYTLYGYFGCSPSHWRCERVPTTLRLWPADFSSQACLWLHFLSETCAIKIKRIIIWIVVVIETDTDSEVKWFCVCG